MKFDVLKGMVDKSMDRSAAGVSDDADSSMDTLQKQLEATFAQLTAA